MKLRTIAILTAAAGIAAYFASGFYSVQPDERGVVRWFGRATATSRRVPPGMHYALPWPFCRVASPKTSEVRRVYVGIRPEHRRAIADGNVDAMRASPASDTLTGDVNILKTTMVVQYQVADPARYLFGAADPLLLVRSTVQGVLIEVLAGMPVDEALTVAKSRLQLETLSEAQRRLDEYACGVRLIAANLETIDPPRAVIAAFQDVVSAKKDGERSVDRAVGEANRILPLSRGEAATTRQQALAYETLRVSRARGESDRFVRVLAEYSKSPGVFRQRLLLQTLEKVLPNIRTYILDHQPGDPPTSIKIIESNNE